MITFSYAPPCGSAVSLTLRIGPTVEAWRLLRRADADFTGYDDPDAVVVDDGDECCSDPAIFDFAGLTNGVAAFYRVYVREAGVWGASGDPVSVVPAYVAEPLYSSPDLASLLRTRLFDGLRAEVASGRLDHESGAVPVLSANPLLESVRLPVVTAILTTRRAEVRGVGEQVIPDAFENDFWSVFEGWLDRSTVEITVWALNHDDRLRLRDAVQRVLMLNLPVLDAAGFLLPDLSESEGSDFESFAAPIYHSVFTLSCLHAALVRAQVPPIRSLEVQNNVYPQNNP